MSVLLFAGSRGIVPSDDLLNWASYCLDRHVDVVIHGGARGVDLAAGVWAANKGYEVEVHTAEWDELGKKAGFVRNSEMVGLADAAIVIWDGESRGTRHTLGLIAAKGIPYVLVRL